MAKTEARNVKMEMSSNGGCKITYEEAEKGDKHSAKRLTEKEETFSKEDMKSAIARMQELNGIEATDKEVEEKEEPEEENEESEQGEEGNAMEEQPTAMDDNVRLPHED